MAGKGRQTPRKPATKFAHLRKKMEKNRIAAKISKKKEIAARNATATLTCKIRQRHARITISLTSSAGLSSPTQSHIW